MFSGKTRLLFFPDMKSTCYFNTLDAVGRLIKLKVEKY